MKKLILVMLSLFAAFQGLKADASDRFAVFTLGAGVMGVYNDAKVTENIPVDYTQSPNYVPYQPWHDLNSTSNPVNKMCKSGTCDISQFGGGFLLEAGVKLRFTKIVEFDLWGDFGFAFMGNGLLPNSVTLKNWSYDYKYTDGSFASVEAYMMRFALNATATLRLGRFGIIGGLGGVYQSVVYHAKLRNSSYFSSENDTQDRGEGIMYSYPLHFIAGISYAVGPNLGNGEIILRFSMPFVDAVDSKSGNNGYVDYDETYTTRPYMINLVFRRYF
ncbi:hypothetical protein DCO58_00750 [Helicobacter saguini]|uniref:Outer membrane protein beta-barrel domain-containing protein n=1 Tax=Helicobacter saguini TaxID=1548018 RepID=A0A347VR11_9HELI|nr:hypothetical protein [Helicobacter saguini]MWV63081.1 hypothetical protein [Helicobacter saguini]MWV66249.1 hypothetical protein [Helicobacter saguini]MWV68602.1 hypothetical protein [Helicobacter saguini]MWV71847.1 hypothetical protein [Helicobacter saguini]TLD95866.1 hypothetical protein LS64_000420 [Helicobacter saguini]